MSWLSKGDRGGRERGTAGGRAAPLSSSRILLAAFFGLGLAALCLAALFPELDLWVSTWLAKEDGSGFYRHHPGVMALRSVSQTVISTTIGFLVLALIAFAVRRRMRLGRLELRPIGYVALCLVLGPGLIVNSVAKPLWGRPRPYELERFGGKEEFRSILEPDASREHSSCPSGEAAMGFLVFAVGFVARQRREAWKIAGLFMGLAVGSIRMVQGGHFLSDVLLAGLIVYSVCLVLSWLLLRPRAASAPSPARARAALRDAAETRPSAP